MQNVQENRGFCIRCGKPILKNSRRPFCNVCYKVWDMYKNKSYIENYCHSCGKKKSGLSINNSICNDCRKTVNIIKSE